MHNIGSAQLVKMEQTNGMNVYVIRDLKLKTCGPLFLAKDDESAKTLVGRSLVSPDGKPSSLAVFGDGYVLVRLGEFDSDNCELTANKLSTSVCRIDELVRGVVVNFKAVSEFAAAFLENIPKEAN